MKKREISLNKLNDKQTLFYIAYSLYLVFAILSRSFLYNYIGNSCYRVIKLIYILLLVINETIELQTKRKNYSFISLGISILIYSIFALNEKVLSDVALTVVLVYCGRNASFKKIAKITIILSFITVLVVVCSSYLGIIENYISEIRKREYLGFTYVLYSPAIISNVTGLYIYLKNREIKYIELLILFLINYWFYLKTDARLSFYAIVMMLVLVLLFKLMGNNTLFQDLKVFLLKKLTIYAMPVLCLLSFVIGYTYNSTNVIMNKINGWINNRILFTSYSLTNYGVSLLGDNTIPWRGSGLDMRGNVPTGTYLWVDNLYVFASQRFGILVVILLLVLITLALSKLANRNEYWLLMLFGFLAIRLCIDDLYLYLFFNTLWFIIPMQLKD